MNSVDYDQNYYEGNGQNGDRPALAFHFNVFRKCLPKGVVLEYGAGLGHLNKRLATVYEAYAREVSEHANKIIKKVSPKSKLIRSDNDFKENFFDGVISLHTLEHVPNPTETLKLFNKIMKKDGVLYFVVPNAAGLGHRIKKDKWFGYRDKTHITLTTADNWIELVEDNGFEVIKTSSDGFWDVPYIPFIPVFLQKLIFFPTSALLLLLKRLPYPNWFGEDLILVARKKS